MPIYQDNISQLTLGIRFEKSFRVSDITGQIFDNVLHDNSSPFGTDFFPNYQAFGAHDRWLFNGDRGHHLRITTSDVIFQYTIQASSNLEKESNWFKQDATNFIIDKVFKENRIKNIMRVGFMISHRLQGENVGGRVLDKLTSGDIRTADQFTLRFGNKDATADGMSKSGVNDYINKITTIKQVSEAEYDITLDFQYYFLPSIDNLHGWDITSFYIRAMNNLSDKFYPMINAHLGDLVEVK
jgi:hypothetical protein